MNFEKKENEKEIEYIIRLFKNRKEYDLDYSEIFKLAFDVELASDEARKRFYGINMFIEKMDKTPINNSTDDILNKIIEQKQELKKERIKLSDERTIFNKSLRKRAREEEINETIEKSIKTLKPINFPEEIELIESDKSAILCISDQHFGKEFEIKDFSGNILNKYNIDIFKNRMNNLKDKVIQIIKKEEINKLHIFSLGDSIEGMLRINALKQLQLGLTDSAIQFSYFMINWLNELSKYIKIEYRHVLGNHDDIRVITNQKGDFPEENMGKIIYQFIKLGLKDNPNIDIVDNKDHNFIYCNIAGYDILGLHNAGNNISDTLKNYEYCYKSNIDIVLAGHIHHNNTQNVGIEKNIICVPSIVGADSYSISLKKVSDPGAKLLILEKSVNDSITYDIKL